VINGRTAAGHRVLLPWGGNNFDVNHLNADGLTILRRAIEWGAGTVLPLAPIAHWKLDETSGTKAIDSEGGHDGTLTNGPSWDTGSIDGGLSFDGANDYVNVPYDANLSLTGGMTFTAWVNTLDTSGGYKAILATDVPGNGASNYWFGIENDELVFGFWAVESFRTVKTSGSNLQSDTWYHLAASFDNATDVVRLYVDGTEVHMGTITYEPTTETADLWIGHSVDGEYWSGTLDDVRIYDSVLGQAEISDIANAGGGGPSIEPPGTCNGTFRDEFNAVSFGNNDGTLNWAGDWLEVGESDGPGSNDVRVRDDNGPYQLWLRDKQNGGEGVEREADLSGAAAATLSFEYRRSGLDRSSDYVKLEISSNGAAGPWAELTRFQGSATDSAYQSFSQDISAYISAATRIRLITSPTMGATDTVMFDNIQIQCSP